MQKYTFDNYVVNMYNRNAYETAKEFIKMKMEKGMMLGIFGLEGTGKTKLLQAIANYYEELNPESTFYISKEELKQEIEKAIKRKDILLLSLKKKVKNTEVVCIDEIREFLIDDRLKPWYMTWFCYCKKRKKRLIYTHDCDERMYSTIGALASLDSRVTMIGIPKPGQNRNIEVMKELD